MKVEEILRRKGSEVKTIRPDASVATLAQRLRLERVGALVVSEDGARIAGIVSERDLVHGLAEHGARCLAQTVADLMTVRVVTCGPDDRVSQIARLMTDYRIRHLPVVEGTRLIGLVSIGDVVKNRIAEMELEAEVLRDMAMAGR